MSFSEFNRQCIGEALTEISIPTNGLFGLVSKKFRSIASAFALPVARDGELKGVSIISTPSVSSTSDASSSALRFGFLWRAPRLSASLYVVFAESSRGYLVDSRVARRGRPLDLLGTLLRSAERDPVHPCRPPNLHSCCVACCPLRYGHPLARPGRCERRTCRRDIVVTCGRLLHFTMMIDDFHFNRDHTLTHKTCCKLTAISFLNYFTKLSSQDA